MPMSIADRLRYAAPQAFYTLAGRLVPWLAVSAVLAGAAGLYVAFFVAPTDAQQGEVCRIVFVHVPAAWMSMFIYVVMAFWAAVGLSLNTRLAFMMAHALAPTGAMFTFLALWTGAIWGKPTWGAWWVWDARLASELILLFLYLGYMALNAAIDDPRRADRACALLALAGTLNLPLIYYSVPNIAGRMPLQGVLIMGAAFWMYSIALALSRVRCVILEREQESEWAGAQFCSRLEPGPA
jgi:heme exporter protein C